MSFLNEISSKNLFLKKTKCHKEKYKPIDKILNYKEFLQEKTQTKLLKEKTRTGKPCGDDDFYDRIEILTGINYKNKKAGRPKKEQGFD